MPVLTRDLILERTNRDIRKVKVPGTDDTYCILALSSTAKEEWMNFGNAKHNAENFDAIGFAEFLLVRALCDEKGELQFDETECDLVGQLPASVVNYLYDEIMKHSMLVPDEMGGLEKNSETHTSADFGSN